MHLLTMQTIKYRRSALIGRQSPNEALRDRVTVHIYIEGSRPNSPVPKIQNRLPNTAISSKAIRITIAEMTLWNSRASRPRTQNSARSLGISNFAQPARAF